MTDQKPLSGYRIVDLSANMSGPLATMILGDLGADVVKVEPPSGDAVRQIGSRRGGMTAYFANLNRSKRSVVLDLRQARAVEAFERLVDTADVVTHNLRPDAIERLGLDGPRLRANRPRLIYGSILGFGRSGPYADRPAYDHALQALGGWTDCQRDVRAGEAPRLVRQGLIDKVTAHAFAHAITLALLQRERTGSGSDVTLCMLNVAVSVLWPDGMMHRTILEPDLDLPPISQSFRVTPTADGHLCFTVGNDKQYHSLAGLVGAEQSTNGHREGARGPVMRAVGRLLADLPTVEAVATLVGADIACAPVTSLDELADNPQIKACRAIDDFDHDVLGPVHQANPFHLTAAGPASAQRPAPQLGQHTAEILAELGYGPEEMETLTCR